MKKLILNEEVYAPDTIFVDTATGKSYAWNGSQFVEMKPGQNQKSQDDKSKDDGKPKIGDRPKDDDEESKRIRDEEEKQRQAEDDERYEADENARLQRIQDILNNPNDEARLKSETERKVAQSRERKREFRRQQERELKKYSDASGIEGFIASINDFIKNEIKKETIKTYARLNKSYNSNTGPIIRQGKMQKKNFKIPRINVYYDQSGSWGPSDIKIGNAAIATLNKYVKKKELIVNIFYFDTEVSDSTANMGGGTSGPPVIDHIMKTRPDNVVIMTDSDTSDQLVTDKVTVPGGVWFLWRHGLKSEFFIESLRGMKLTKEYNITGA